MSAGSDPINRAGNISQSEGGKSDKENMMTEHIKGCMRIGKWKMRIDKMEDW